MAVVNIAVDASINNNIDIADAAAAAGDILVQFFSDGKNVFNKASQSLGGEAGEVVVTAGVKYTVNVPAADGKLLTGAACTYKLSKAATTNTGLLGSPERTMPVKDNGTVTVSNLEVEADTLISFINGNNQTPVTDNYTALPGDDIIFVNAAGSKDITLPDNTLMIGKKFSVKKIGAGDVVIKDKDGGTIYTLDETTEANVDLVATAGDWVTFN